MMAGLADPSLGINILRGGSVRYMNQAFGSSGVANSGSTTILPAADDWAFHCTRYANLAAKGVTIDRTWGHDPQAWQVIMGAGKEAVAEAILMQLDAAQIYGVKIIVTLGGFSDPNTCAQAYGLFDPASNDYQRFVDLAAYVADKLYGHPALLCLELLNEPDYMHVITGYWRTKHPAGWYELLNAYAVWQDGLISAVKGKQLRPGAPIGMGTAMDSTLYSDANGNAVMPWGTSECIEQIIPRMAAGCDVWTPHVYLGENTPTHRDVLFNQKFPSFVQAAKKAGKRLILGETGALYYGGIYDAQMSQVLDSLGVDRCWMVRWWDPKVYTTPNPVPVRSSSSVSSPISSPAPDTSAGSSSGTTGGTPAQGTQAAYSVSGLVVKDSTGAVAYTASNATAAIQWAIDNVADGGVVNLGAEEFVIVLGRMVTAGPFQYKSGLVIRKDIKLQGQGVGKTVLKVANGQLTQYGEGWALIIADGFKGLVLDSMTLDGNRANNAESNYDGAGLLYTWGYQYDPVLSNLELRNSPTCGFYLGNNGGGRGASGPGVEYPGYTVNPHILNIHSHDNYYVSMWLDSPENPYLENILSENDGVGWKVGMSLAGLSTDPAGNVNNLVAKNITLRNSYLLLNKLRGAKITGLSISIDGLADPSQGIYRRDCVDTTVEMAGAEEQPAQDPTEGAEPSEETPESSGSTSDTTEGETPADEAPSEPESPPEADDPTGGADEGTSNPPEAVPQDPVEPSPETSSPSTPSKKDALQLVVNAIVQVLGWLFGLFSKRKK